MKRESNYKKKHLQLVKDFFKQQEVHTNKWNEEIYHEAMKLHLIEENFDSVTPQVFETACAKLCPKSYRKYKAQYNRISEYKKIDISDSEIHVRSFMYITAPVWICLFNDNLETYIYCKCEISCAYEMQCIHSIIANKFHFVPSHFEKRHFRRYKESCSYSNLSLKERKDDEHLSETQTDSYNEDDLDNRRFIEVDNTANNDITNKQRTTSNFDSTKIITNNNNTKSLTIEELRGIFNKVILPNMLRDYNICTGFYCTVS